MTQLALSGGTVMAVLLMAVIVLGYVVIWAIWHFFFRGAGDSAADPQHSPSSSEDDRQP